MRGVVLPLAAASFLGVAYSAALAQEAVRFDRPVYTTEAAALCPRQGDITALRRALEDGDRAAFERVASQNCKAPGPDIRLTVVAMPGLYDPDVEVRVASAPNLDPSLPRSKLWTLKTMLSNQPSGATVAAPSSIPR
jgi:hypothetical protein